MPIIDDSSNAVDATDLIESITETISGQEIENARTYQLI